MLEKIEFFVKNVIFNKKIEMLEEIEFFVKKVNF